jgi:hypothetical protein
MLAPIVSIALAQQTSPWQVRRAYINLSADFSNGGSVQFNLHFNNKWTGFLGYDFGNPESKNLPANYKRGTSSFLGIEWEDPIPTDEFSAVSLGVGRVLTRQSDKAWITGTCAITVGRYNELQFVSQEVQAGYYLDLFGGTSSNYSYTSHAKTMVGITPGLEAHVNLVRYMALSGGGRMHISNAGIFPRFQVGFDFGLMRPSKKNMIRRDSPETQVQ